MPETGNLYYEGFIKLKVILFLATLCIVFTSNVLHAQDITTDDSTITRKRVDPATLDSGYHSPQKAALLSAIVPGLGQVYNKKYWKVPIVFGGFVSLAYLIRRNDKLYKIWRQAYIDYDSSYYVSPVGYQIPKESVNLGKDFYKRQKELSIIATVGFYALQIIDATVDGYLFTWSVGKDLSLKVEPTINSFPAYPRLTTTNSFGLRACLSF